MRVQAPNQLASSTSPPLTYSVTISALSFSANHSWQAQGAASARRLQHNRTFPWKRPKSASAAVCAAARAAATRREAQAVRVFQLGQNVNLVQDLLPRGARVARLFALARQRHNFDRELSAALHVRRQFHGRKAWRSAAAAQQRGQRASGDQRAEDTSTLSTRSRRVWTNAPPEPSFAPSVYNDLKATRCGSPLRKEERVRRCAGCVRTQPNAPRSRRLRGRSRRTGGAVPAVLLAAGATHAA